MSLKTEDLIPHLWRTSPARMAHKLMPRQFKRYKHIDHLDRILMALVAEKNARIVISMPPRHGKSWMSSLFLPAWYLSMFPDKNVILTSYEASFAAGWGRRVRNFLQEHAKELDIELASDSTAADRFNTKQGGGMITAGVGGAITGRGGDLIIVDDPIKNWEEAYSDTHRQKIIDWWNSTLFTRCEPGASIIVLMTRWHQGDLAGYLMSSENESQKDWREVRIPAIAEEADPLNRAVGEALCPERYDAAALQSIRKSVGSRAWAALYQQSPSAAEGNIILRNWLRFWTNLPQPEEFIISCDATFTGKATSDFVAIQVWARLGATKYLVDQAHARMGITDTINALLSLIQRWPQAKLRLIENKANGPAIEDLLKRHISGIVLWEPTGDKVARMNVVAPQFEAGNVYFPLPATSPWVQDLVEEIVTFPNAVHDDRCFIAGTQIKTIFGNKPIEEITTKDILITPLGLSRVIDIGSTGSANVISRFGLVGTASHQVIGKHGKKRLDAITMDDLVIFSWKYLIRWGVLRSFYFSESNIDSWAARNAIIFLSQQPMTEERAHKVFIALFGKHLITLKFLSAIRFTTKTATHLIMTLLILSVYRAAIIIKHLGMILKRFPHPLRWLELVLRNGIDPKRAESGIESTHSSLILESLDTLKRFVYFVKTNLRQKQASQNFVAKNVPKGGTIETKNRLTNLSVANAEQMSKECFLDREEIVRWSVPEDALDFDLPLPVYNIKTTDGVYFANDILVSNCDALSMALLRLEDSCSRGVGVMRIIRR